MSFLRNLYIVRQVLSSPLISDYDSNDKNKNSAKDNKSNDQDNDNRMIITALIITTNTNHTNKETARNYFESIKTPQQK